MASTQSRRSFSCLPPEIRNRIYRYLYPVDHFVTPTLKVNRCQEGNFPGCFLRTSKISSAEAAPVLYSSNHFSFKSVYDGVLFMKKIGQINRTHEKEMSFGTFWLTKDRTEDFSLKYEGAQDKVIDWIATSFPSLTFLSFGGLGPCGTRWQMKTLVKLKYLICRFTALENVLYSKRPKRIVLGAGPIDEILKVRDKYAAFDVEDLIDKTKVKPKAVIRPTAKTMVTAPNWNVVSQPIGPQKPNVVDETSGQEATVSAETACGAKGTARANKTAAMEAKSTTTKKQKLIEEDIRRRLAAAFLRG